MKYKADIVILGAGIGGYETFKKLDKLFKKHKIKKKILLVDRNNYFTFTPLLHEVASGAIQPNQCAIPIRECIYKTSHNFLKAEVNKIDSKKKIVKTSMGDIEYGYCVVAMGSKTNFFNIPGAKQYSEHVRTLSAANKLHIKFIRLLEKEEIKHVHIVVVGAGATGVEVAGQFHHLREHDTPKLYEDTKISITLVHRGDKILPFSNKKFREKIVNQLNKNKIKILTNSTVNEVKKSSVVIEGGKEVPSTITIWTAGFTYEGEKCLGEDYCKNKQILVDEFLRCKGSPSLYAVGDITYAFDQKN